MKWKNDAINFWRKIVLLVCRYVQQYKLTYFKIQQIASMFIKFSSMFNEFSSKFNESCRSMNFFRSMNIFRLMNFRRLMNLRHSMNLRLCLITLVDVQRIMMIFIWSCRCSSNQLMFNEIDKSNYIVKQNY
jgi:hypothetical protein